MLVKRVIIFMPWAPNAVGYANTLSTITPHVHVYCEYCRVSARCIFGTCIVHAFDFAQPTELDVIADLRDGGRCDGRHGARISLSGLYDVCVSPLISRSPWSTESLRTTLGRRALLSV